MSMKVDKASMVESPRSINPPASNQKVTMFGAKSGFVIPRNKLSGSLVPAVRVGKKLGGSDATNEENTKLVQRKTNWGPDLTLDASVRRGRALAYQTRVDQITQQLKSVIPEIEENQDMSVTAQVLDQESSDHQINDEKFKLLELEWRELIGEILKLNPSYKAPPDYKPILKEARIPIPVKEHPGYDFIGLICGSGSDTVKRLEKETGAKVHIYGTKAVTGEKREISPSDVNENHFAYEELYIHISADTFEKVDAAVSLIELLVTPISANPAAAVSTTPTSVPADSVNVPSQSQESATPHITPPVVGNQGMIQHHSESQFQLQSHNWITSTPLHTPLSTSGFTPLPASASFLNSPSHLPPQPFNPTAMSSLFNAPPAPMASFGPPRSQQPMQGVQHPYLHLAGPLSHIGSLRNPSISGPPQPPLSQPNVPGVFTSSQPTPTGLPSTSRSLMPSLPSFLPRPPQGMLSERPLTPGGNSSGWSAGPAGTSSNFVQRPPQLFQTQGHRHVPPQTLVSSRAPPTNSTPNMGLTSSFPFQTCGPQSSASSLLKPVAIPTPAPGQIQASLPVMPVPLSVSLTPPVQSGITTSVSGILPSFTPLRPPSVAAPRPQHPSSGDFTFQPLHAQNPTATGQQPPLMPQTPSFRPAVPASGPQPIMQPFLRPQASNQIGQPQAQVPLIPLSGNPNSMSIRPRLPSFPTEPPTPPVTQLGLRNPSPALQMPNVAGPFLPRPGNPSLLQQTYLPSVIRPENAMAPNAFVSGKPGHGPSGGHQVYDPFSPTSTPRAPQQGGDLSKARKQDSDPEYEDLMASVGVR